MISEIADHDGRNLEQLPLANDRQVSLPGSLCTRLSVAPNLSASADALVIRRAPSVPRSVERPRVYERHHASFGRRRTPDTPGPTNDSLRSGLCRHLGEEWTRGDRHGCSGAPRPGFVGYKFPGHERI